MSAPGTAAASPGTVVAGRYEIERLVARGGMAAVYLAQQRNLRRKVALKILTPPRNEDDRATFEERFRLEAETLASFDHRHIVTLYDYGEVDEPSQLTQQGRFFLAMEFVDGPRLADLLKEGPLPAVEAVRLMGQVCRALRYAHRRGVVHRDLKPSNLLVKYDDDGEPQIKVVDFGLVKLQDDDQSITRAGVILGSPHCMAPEQIRGEPIDHRADIYATGVLLFRSILGRYPFHGATSAATMIAHLNDPVPAFAEAAPTVPTPVGLEAVVGRCLAKEPADRFQDMASLFQALQHLDGLPGDSIGGQSLSLSQSMSMTPPAARLVGTPAPAPTSAEGSLERRVAEAPTLANVGLITVGALMMAAVVLLAVLVGIVVGAATWDLGFDGNPLTDPVEAPMPEPEPVGDEHAEAGTAEEEDSTAGEGDTDSEGEGEEVVEQEEDPTAASPAATPPRVVAPAPVPSPAPAAPKAAPKPKPEPDGAPEGYLEMPDDLFGDGE